MFLSTLIGVPLGSAAALKKFPGRRLVINIFYTFMGFPPGFPELAPIEVEVVIVTLFGLLMPILGYYAYRREERRARVRGTLSAY